ncbi:hypothetical protein [Pollutibacter soli]|uniref:hypothetical protein n=1 Tax=Pollutibacter soli TaxID=3034157 RepID=UPI003013D5CE
MSTISPSQQAEQVQAKVARLIKQYKALEKENTRLKSELGRVQDAEEHIRQQNRQLEQQLNVIRATGTGDETARKELEKQLSFYIREIDKCISILAQ